MYQSALIPQNTLMGDHAGHSNEDSHARKVWMNRRTKFFGQ